MKNDLLTINQLCAAFQITRPTEFKMRKQGILKPTIQKGRLIRYSMNDLKSEMKETPVITGGEGRVTDGRGV